MNYTVLLSKEVVYEYTFDGVHFNKAHFFDRVFLVLPGSNLGFFNQFNYAIGQIDKHLILFTLR